MKILSHDELQKLLDVKITKKEHLYLVEFDYVDKESHLILLCNYRYSLLKKMEDKIIETHKILVDLINT
jgi:hypothetical protein